MSNLVKISDLKIAKKLGLTGGFLVFPSDDGYHVLFQSQFTGDKFYLQSQRFEGVRNFKTLEAVKNAIVFFDWSISIF
jgi:hypothetical protein